MSLTELQKKMDEDDLKPRLNEEQIRRLKANFDRYVRKEDALLPENLLEKVIDASRLDLREGERKRLINLAQIVSEGVPWETLFTLANGWIDVNMLHTLFQEANTDTALERVEFFLDTDEILAILTKIGIEKSKADIESELDKLDKDSDGRCDWEEFLTVSTAIIGASVNVNKNDPDGTDFNQLRDSTKLMKANLYATNDVVKDYDETIKKKKAEIEKRMNDTTLEDVRTKLKAEWDQKDVLEMKLLDSKTEHYKVLEKMLSDNDAEKNQLVERFDETIGARDQVRTNISVVRGQFGNRFNEQFVEVASVQEILADIDKASKEVHNGLDAANEMAGETKKAWSATAEFEKPPTTSVSTKGLEFISNQNAVMSEITTKMKMMQRERDKYEDMIEEEMTKNKTKRIECVNLNMKITNLETQEMAVMAKCKDLEIQNLTLKEELKKKLEDVDSKKVKELKNTVWQFKEERDAIVEQVEDIRSKMRHVTKMLDLSKKKASQLNIELGELKILLEGIRGIGDDDDDLFGSLSGFG